MRARDFADLLGIERLDDALDEVAAAMSDALIGSAELVVPATRVVVDGGGKRLRPLLTIASALAADPATVVNPLDRGVKAGAAAVELVHVGSLVHDDIIDDAATRRGVVTVNAQEGVSQAVLVGDFLLARAGVEAATVSADVAMSLATTISDLCDGQSLEGAHEFSIDRSIDDAFRSIAGKTGALMRASCDIGALAVGQNEHAVRLGEFGMNFGIAFQLADDLLDLLSTEELMGKPVNNDVRSGVYTAPALFALALSSDRQRTADLMTRASADDSAAEQFRDELLGSGAVEQTLSEVAKFNDAATQSLDTLPDSPAATGLRALPQTYLDSILAEKAATLTS